MKTVVTSIVLLVLALGQRSNAGFLQSPFSYFFNPGAPITSAASPYIHGFGSPAVFSPLVNFYHPQPILKTFYQPIIYHQPPQFLNLPTPQFFALPQTSASAPAPTGGYPAAEVKEEEKSGQRPPGTGYGTPSRDGYSGTGPSGTSGSAPIEVFEDDFMGDKQSVVVDSDRARNPNAFQQNQQQQYPQQQNQQQQNQQQPYQQQFQQRQQSNEGFQSFIVNSSQRDRPSRQGSEYVYRDNSVRDGQDRPRAGQGQRPTNTQQPSGGYQQPSGGYQ